MRMKLISVESCQGSIIGVLQIALRQLLSCAIHRFKSILWGHNISSISVHLT